MIIDEVLPQDMDNFCGCCQELEQSAEIAPKRHQKMEKNYSEVTCVVIFDNHYEPHTY